MRRKEINATAGETIEVTNLWAAECEERVATVLTSSWAASCIPVTGPTLTGSTAKGLLVLLSPGKYNIRNTVALSNGETLVADRYVCVS